MQFSIHDWPGTKHNKDERRGKKKVNSLYLKLTIGKNPWFCILIFITSFVLCVHREVKKTLEILSHLLKVTRST